MQKWSQTDWREWGKWSERRGVREKVPAKGSGGSHAVTIPQFCLGYSTKFSFWKSDTTEIMKNHQAMSQSSHWALYKQMSHRTPHRQGQLYSNFCTGVLMSAGFLCWFDKQNTIVAYFTSVPVCQAVCGEEGFSSKHNGEFDTVVCFQLLALSVPLADVHKDTVWLSCLLSLQAQHKVRRGHRFQHHVETLVNCEPFFCWQCCGVPHFAHHHGPHIPAEKKRVSKRAAENC